VPVFFDSGRRSYVLAEYTPWPSITVEAKYGITSYVNRTSIGSGYNRVQGSTRRAVGVQVQWTL